VPEAETIALLDRLIAMRAVLLQRTACFRFLLRQVLWSPSCLCLITLAPSEWAIDARRAFHDWGFPSILRSPDGLTEAELVRGIGLPMLRPSGSPGLRLRVAQ
jgi:hypothetical protein